jgi:hypothetical protein
MTPGASELAEPEVALAGLSELGGAVVTAGGGAGGALVGPGGAGAAVAGGGAGAAVTGGDGDGLLPDKSTT